MHFQFTLFSTRVHLSILNCMVNRGRSVQKPLHLWNLHILAKVQPHLSWAQQRWRPQNPTHWVEPWFMEEVVMISPRVDPSRGQPLQARGSSCWRTVPSPGAGGEVTILWLQKGIQPSCPQHCLSTWFIVPADAQEVWSWARGVWWCQPTHGFQWSPWARRRRSGVGIV